MNHSIYYSDRSPEYKEWNRIYQNRYYMRRKERVIAHYSNNTRICKHCGFSDMMALSIDHVNGGGEAHRKLINKKSGNEFYWWLIDQNFPDGYQVLCMNCQSIKRYTNHEGKK